MPSSPSTAMATDLPIDVWRKIIDFLPTDSLLLLANARGPYPFAVLREAGLKARYSTVVFMKSDKATKEFLKDLWSESDIAQMVNCVNIYPWLVAPRTKSARSKSEMLWNLASTLVDPDYLKNQAEKRVQKRLRKDVLRLQGAIASLSAVREYGIHWDEKRPYHPELYRGFLLPILKALGSHLEKLTIKIPPEMLGSLARAALPNLQELDLRLYTGAMNTNEIRHTFDALLVFLHNLKDSLRSLSISSTNKSENLDLCYLFANIGTFPFLRSIRLSIPFDGRQLSSTAPFEAFLDNHRSRLEYLTLSASSCSVNNGSADGMSAKCANWIQSIVGAASHVPFPELRGVELALRPLRADLTPLFSFLSVHRITLESLTLTDRTLTWYEVEMLLDALSGQGRLRQIHLSIRSLSPEILSLLASRLPRLGSLRLAFTEVAANGVKGSWKRQMDEVKDLRYALRQRKRDYENWILRNLAISAGPQNSSESWLDALEQQLVECIPSLESVTELLH
ncbi:hypothetical protein BDQ12DRAFT_656632 [Crucibulum laeve]|uniref:F-box domain-containing protein n=1 Tax=Crucibulum laeve TaxID=68775 RepID=A0A5C3M127_9AGAR|nr:hypothetical protein BDQ12DRAFT_656632 [Crucibulum laeve]